MRLAMVIGEQRLALEQRMLNRLVVGLMADGVQVTRIVPEGLPPSMVGEGERRMALARRIETRMHALPWMRKANTQNIVDALGDVMPDVLYLLGEDSWTVGLALAGAIDRPAILEVWSNEQIAHLPRASTAGRTAQLAAVTAPCAGIAEVVRERVGSDMTALVPMGVAAGNAPLRLPFDPDRPPSIAVIGGARDLQAYSALLNGLAKVAHQHPGMQVFVELRGPHEHDLWRMAERAGIIHAVSTVGSAAQHSSLLTRCDIAIWPEPFGELRTVMLETMAMAVPIIAVANPALDMLQHERTALMVTNPTAETWASNLLDLLADDGRSQQLGQNAREHILAHHRSSGHIASLVSLIERINGKDAYAFPTPA